MQNVSAGGARLRIALPGCDLKPGRLLELVLTNQAGGVELPVRLRLAHSAELDNGDYEVGGAFIVPLSRGDLAALAGGALA